MRLKSTIIRTAGTAVSAAAICLLLAGGARADCGLFSIPRSVASFAGSSATAVGNASQADHAAATAMETFKTSGDDNTQGASIVGLWLTTFSSGGQIVDQGFDMWTSDGTEILNDTPPPATGNVCLGTFIRIGPNTFRLKHPSWTFDGGGNLNGTAIIRETVTVQPGKNTFKGTFTVDVLTLAGDNLQHLSGTITGTRITVD